MEISVTELEPGIQQISLSGRFDAEGVGQIRAQFAAATQPKPILVIVEMSGVSFMASTAIRLLLTGAKSLISAGGRMVIAGAREHVKYPLTISKVNTVIPLFKTVEEAKNETV